MRRYKMRYSWINFKYRVILTNQTCWQQHVQNINLVRSFVIISSWSFKSQLSPCWLWALLFGLSCSTLSSDQCLLQLLHISGRCSLLLDDFVIWSGKPPSITCFWQTVVLITPLLCLWVFLWELRFRRDLSILE